MFLPLPPLPWEPSNSTLYVFVSKQLPSPLLDMSSEYSIHIRGTSAVLHSSQSQTGLTILNVRMNPTSCCELRSFHLRTKYPTYLPIMASITNPNNRALLRSVVDGNTFVEDFPWELYLRRVSLAHSNCIMFKLLRNNSFNYVASEWLDH